MERTPTPDQASTATVVALQLANRVLATRVATLGATSVAPIGPESDSETIRQFLLASTRNWNTLWADARINGSTSAEASAAPLERRFQVWINQKEGRFRVLSSRYPDRVEAFAVSDGQQVRLMDVETGQVRTRPLPGGETPPLAALNGDLSTPLADLIYPALLAQSGGTFQAVGVARLAGRDALVVEYTPSGGSVSERLWVDRQTGAFLRRVSQQKGGDRQDALDILVTDIQYGVPLPSSLFNLQISEIPQFAQDYSGAAQLIPEGLEATPSPEASPQARLYFYVPDAAGHFQLMRLPGRCLLDDSPCPFPQAIPNQPVLEGQPQPMLWSPDGSRALVAVAGSPGRLYLYTPDGDAWQLVVETPQPGAAAWSPDGTWFAYTARQDSTTDIFLSAPDGKQPRNLTEGRLSGPPASVSHLTWQGPGRLLFAETSANDTRVYTLEVDSGKMTAVEDPGPKNELAPLPSPDGRIWAWTELSGARVNLVLGSAGTAGRVAAAFTHSSIWPLAWSPDGQQLAFVVYGGLPGQETADLFITGADGSGLIQLYRSQRILAFAWVTGARQLVVEADDGSGYTHLFLVSLSDGGGRILQAPGLRLDASWTAPSWGPG